ncbi:MAG: hypothetical protein WBD22_10425 [Pyrinomonadaceae bacterium]
MTGIRIDHTRTLQRRIDALRVRIEELSSLRTLVSLGPSVDIGRRQWKVLESELNTVEAKLLRRLKNSARAYLSKSGDIAAARLLNKQLGEIELELAKSFAFFDTFMDVLTQRHTPELGRLLAGCDVLALDAIRKPHPALSIVEPPIVACDRGFGARTFREYIRFPGGGYNPMPLIQIPYSRLREKYNLTSILHEVGHEAMVRCGLITALPKALHQGLKKAGAPTDIRDLYVRWTSEIGPDLWSFCASGIAQAGAIREILALPPTHAFRIIWNDPHPPPYIRVLMSFDWCRQVWGSGVWDRWEREWRDLYPLESAPHSAREVIRRSSQFVPIVSRILLKTKFRCLSGKKITDLFNMSILAPTKIQQRIGTADSPRCELRGLPPSAHLAVFRLLKEEATLDEESLDRLMTRWLKGLSKQRFENAAARN